MLRHRTRAAYEVLSFPGAARQAGVLAAHGGAGTGFPHVRCLFADQYGTIGEGSGRVAIDPVGGSSPSRPLSSLLIGEAEDLDCEVGEAWRPRSVSIRCLGTAVQSEGVGVTYPGMHDWEHCIRDTSQAKRRVFDKNRNS